MERGRITSVGIDIGTTTTQLIFSELGMRNTAGPTQMPRYAITERKILYSSPVAFTPKVRSSGGGAGLEDRLDEAALADMVRHWYADAGIKPDAVTSGAVIVTGESLKLRNARAAVMGLSDALGDFVVATAGPNLESVIAGRGAGAAAMSEKLRGRVLNIDIGGGTANYAVFDCGKVVDTSCLNVGGRLLETDAEGNVTRISKPGMLLIDAFLGRKPDTVTLEHLERLTEGMAALIAEQARGIVSPLTRELLQTSSLRQGWRYDAVTVSGGVGACCLRPPDNNFLFGDIGPLFAKALLRDKGMQSLPVLPPTSTVQATVIGAGAWSLSLSGSTISADAASLPLRNIPVVNVPLVWTGHSDDIAEDLGRHIAECVGRYDLDMAEPFALAFTDIPARYAVLSYLAEGLAAYANTLPERSCPFIVCLGQDMAKALGLLMRTRMHRAGLVVIDEVIVGDGDYLDLGKPLLGGVIPLVVKSLAFSG